MNTQNYGNRPDAQEKEGKSFWKGLGIFALSLFLAVLTVVTINL